MLGAAQRPSWSGGPRSAMSWRPCSGSSAESPAGSDHDRSTWVYLAPEPGSGPNQGKFPTPAVNDGRGGRARLGDGPHSPGPPGIQVAFPAKGRPARTAWGRGCSAVLSLPGTQGRGPGPPGTQLSLASESQNPALMGPLEASQHSPALSVPAPRVTDARWSPSHPGCVCLSSLHPCTPCSSHNGHY